MLNTPIHNHKILLERQQIFLDFCKYPFLINKIDEYCNHAAAFYLKPFGKNFKTANDRLKYYITTTLELLNLYDEFPKILSNLQFNSMTLGKYTHNSYASVKDELTKLSTLYSSPYFSLNIAYNAGFKLMTASLNDVKNIKIPIKYITKKKRVTDILLFSENYIYFGNNGYARNVINELKDSLLLNLCQNISQINSKVKSFFLNLSLGVEFYKGALILKKYMEDKKLSFCMPEFVGFNSGISAKSLYDLGLALSIDEKIISNDVCMEKGKILLITGLNRGGKTTFLKSIGIAQILAQAGLFVPAAKYFCPVYQGIMTHFASEEETFNNGKLLEESKRLNKDFHILKGGGLALFNESFSTTTEEEGADIAIDVLRALNFSGSHAIFVTHLMKLVNNRNLVENAVSLTTENSNSYKIVEGEPLPNIYAYEMLKFI